MPQTVTDSTQAQGKGTLLIRKASGEFQEFDSGKLYHSLLQAGAFPDLAKEIVKEISATIHDGISTRKIYQKAFSLLKKNRSMAALHYKLKQAMLELGPTGYPFEQLMGFLFECMGFSVEVGVTVAGQNVTHEMDVIATNGNMQHLMECKYHSDQGHQVSIQVPLYVRSRVNDIVSVRKNQEEFSGMEFTGWVVTNTRFSKDSVAYGRGAGLNMLAWDYPEGSGLKELLEKEGIFPVTILTQLNAKERRSLIDQGVITCNQLLDNLSSIDVFEWSTAKRKLLVQELNGLCAQKHKVQSVE